MGMLRLRLWVEYGRTIDLLKTNSILLLHTPRIGANDVELEDGVGPALVRAYEVGEGAGEEVGLGLSISYDPGLARDVVLVLLLLGGGYDDGVLEDVLGPAQSLVGDE